METPADLRYSKEHEWVKLEGDVAIIGITDFAQKQLTDIVFVELPDKGRGVESGKQIGVIESVKSVSDIFCPVTGEIVEVNEALQDNPDTINKDPYGEGWIVKVKLADKTEVDGLMSTEDYDRFVSESK